jgi:hypothetical protein
MIYPANNIILIISATGIVLSLLLLLLVRQTMRRGLIMTH